MIANLPWCWRIMDVSRSNWHPVYLASGQRLGHVEDVVLCPPEMVDIGKGLADSASQAAVNTLVAEAGTEHIPITDVVAQDKQKRLVKLMEAMTIHSLNLSADQTALLNKLVEEYSDIFALDTTELGSTNLVAHSIDTGDHPPYVSQ